MKVRLSLLTRKVFALIIATSMSIPTNVFASQPEPQSYEEDSSIMGLAQNKTKEEIKPAEINSSKQVETNTYLIDMRATLDDSLTKIDYTIRLKRKNPLAEGEDKDLSLSLVAMPNINSLRLVSASSKDADKESELAVDTSDDDLNSLILKSKAHDEIIYKISADIREAKDGRNYDLAIGLADDNEEVLTYKLIAKEEDLVEGDDTTKTIKLEESDANNLTATYKQEGILGGIFAKYDQIEWTDFLANDTDDVKEFDYDINPDQNQITDESKIRLDYYKMSSNGFVINKEFSQEIDFAEKINFEIPKAYLARLSLSTRVDKKNTHIASYSLNNREIKNPIYIEGSEEENKEGEEDPAPAPTENPASAPDKAPSKANDDPANKEKEENDKEPSQSQEEEEPAEKLSALLLNKDSLEARLKNESRLTDAMAKTVDEITARLYSYDKDQIYWEDLLNFIKAIAQRDKLEKTDLREIIESLITGLNKETYKVANINIDEIIEFVYPQEKENPESPENKEEPTNLEKADKELKEALADKSKGIEEIQALLSSFEEKYKLSREDQEKLMTANNDAITALVAKDREENFRPNVLADQSDSFAGKKFNLKTTMQVKASPAWPIPSGWYFDVNLGPYLREDWGQQLKDLSHPELGLVATARMLRIGNNNVIRYTYVRKVTKSIDLNIDQALEFDAKAIGDQNPITLNIKVAPKNNPVQNLYPITVYENTPSPVTSEYVVKDEGQTQSGTYPYQLDWRTTSQKLKDNNGKVIDKLVDLDKSKLTGAYVEWDIEVDTDKLVDPNNELKFDNLNLTVFGSANQGLTNIYYKASKNPADLETTEGYISSTNLGELLSQNSQISKNDLGKKLYIKVKATIDPDQVHETYSIGFRINPDTNYIDKLLKEYQDKLDKIPTPIKWLKGVKEARRFAEVPFNLVETNIPATFLGLTDRFTNEKFYYDNTRTITAIRKSDAKVDWYALDLIRRGESQNPALDNPDFDRNNGEAKRNIKAKKVYYLPLKDGGYRRTTQAGDVVLQNGQYFPGTIVSYEYPNHSGGRDDTYNFRPDLKDKKKFNIDESYDYEGGRVNLFTEKISDKDLATGYLAYTENPYPIMRINRNFDMVSCFNDRVNAPVYTGNTKVFLDKHEDVSGDYLITRLNESHGRPTDDYSLKSYLGGATYDGVSLNHNGDLSQGQAMEELMKKIYFYGEEVKKEYSKANNNEEMHRLIESSMYQRVIHHFTDGKDLKDDYFQAPSSYNIDDWKVEHTLSGTRQTYPKTGWDGSFAGSDKTRRINNEPGAPRKLKDNETRIRNYPPVQSTQYDMAQALYKKVIASYKEGNDWNTDKADSVKLVFYSHTDEGKYQELIAGRVMAPIEIDKYKKDGTKLADAKFRFTNIDTGEWKEWTSTDDDKAHKLYLRPGKYKVQEMDAPKGYQKIQDFDIEVIRKEIYPDDGRYDAKKLPRIHVNDGFETEVSIDQNTVPKDTDGKTPLVVLDKDNKIKVKVTNIEDNLGKLEFIKRNKFIKLDGAEFRLRKIEAKDLDDAKTKFKDPSKLTYDPKYDKTEKGNIGEFKFEQIPTGFYVLEETKVPAGYEKAPLYLIEAKEIRDASDKKKVEVSFVQEYKEVTNEKGEKEAKIADANLEKEKATRDGKTVYLPIIRNKAKKTEIKFRKVRTEHLGTDKEHLGLGDAKFRLMSLKMVDGDFYLEEAYTDNSTKTTPPRDKVDGQQAEGGGYITFKDLKVGEYLLEELEAPKGYKKTELYGWKLVVSLDEKGNFTHKLYEVPKAEAGENQDKIFNSKDLRKVEISNIIKGHEKVDAYQIGNKSRTIDIDFKKYTGKIVDKDGKTEVEATEVNKKLYGKDGKPVSFNLYNSDFYGAIIGDKDSSGNFIPINKEPIIQDENGLFHLKDLEFGGYYILRETNPPKDYNKADDILLKVEAEAIANEGHMKVIVRDPNTNAKTDFHSVFKGVVDFLEDEKLGKFSIKKVGNAIGYTDDGKPIRVGLRRAYFRLYTADKNYNILKNGDYPKEYIQKVTPGDPITEDDGKGGQKGKDPDKLPPNQGIITFDQLKPGYYVLEEFRGPAGYERDPNPWYILVERDGTVKKYRDNPSKTRNPKQMDYSSHAPRYRMAGLDLFAPIQFNRLMAAPRSDGLEIGKEIIPKSVQAGNVEYTIENTKNAQLYGGTEVTTSVKELGGGVFEVKIDLKNKSERYFDTKPYFDFTFNDDFNFKANSTLSWYGDISNAPTTRWHTAYNPDTKKIGIESGKPAIKKGQTYSIKFEVQAKSDLVTGVYDIIGNITYKHDSNKNTTTQTIDPPRIRVKTNEPVISYREGYEDEIIPMTTETRNDPNLEIGETRTEPGHNGKKRTYYKYEQINGNDTGKKEIDTAKGNNGVEIITNMKPEIIYNGTKQDPGTQEGHKVITSSTGGGTISASPENNVKPGTEVTITITPDPGKKLSELLIDNYKAEVDGNTANFTMSDQDVEVKATFVDENVNPLPTGDMILKANFTYSNQKAGIDDSKSVPEGSPGTVELYINQRQGLVDNWVKVPESERDAPYKGTLEYTGLSLDYDYKLVYTRKTEIAGGWGSETVSEILFNSTEADKNNTITVNISNGNLTEIFNHDETGFRIPLRITKVNENKAALTGSQFKARKLVNGERVPIYEKNEDGTYTDTGKTGFPKYYDEKFDGVSEATGKPGDNYFRELTPGIYELEEIKTPDNTYRPPKDKNGNPMKWYFKVVINKEKVPRDANYMDITFDFEHTFKETDDFNIGITEAEKKALIGKTIKGFKKGDPDFARYIEEVKDDGRSDPARPDAPYKWIHDARVTNYKNKTKLNFFKKDKASYQNIGGAEFSLRKAKLKDGNLVFNMITGNPEYEPEPTTDANGDPLTDEQKDEMRVQPYDKEKNFAKAVSNDQLGVEFTNIGQGTYILEEIKPADGYKPTDSFLAITFTEDEKGSWKQEVKGYEKDENGKYKEMTDTNKFFSKNTKGEFVSVNNEKNYIDLKFQKIEGKKGADGKDIPVESADFKLTQVDKDGKKKEGGYEKTIYSYSNSVFEFKYLPVGRYKLQETRAISKFEKPDPWFFNVVQDEKTYKLKIVFENDPDGTLDKSIGFKTKQNGEPDYDKDGNYQDIKIRNYSKTNFSFMKFRNETDKDGKKLPLKDAYFRLTKVRFSMDEKAKSYEYYGEANNAVLKKYNNGKRVTEYYDTGKVSKFTLNGKVYEFDKYGNLTKVNGNEPSQADKDDIENKRVKPDAISNATGKYSALRRSQSSGKVDFQNLGEGIYQLEEVGIPEGYQSNTKQFKWIFKVEKTDDGLQIVRTYKDKDGKELNVEEEYFKKYDNDYYTNFYSKYNFKTESNITGDGKDKPYEITNTKTTTDLKWKKIGGRNTSNVIKKDTKFVLLKTSNDPKDLDSAKSGQSEFPPFQVESEDGNFEIKNLAKGVYLLKETKAPDGYEIMDRQIGIKVYEDEKGALQKEYFEIKLNKEGNKELVQGAGDFQNLLNRNAQNPETHVEKDGTFYVINKSKPYFFYLRKGFMEEGKFKDITKGKLRIKISKDPADKTNTDTKVYEQEIDLSDAGSYRIDLPNDIQLGKDYILEEVESPDGYAKTKYRYRLSFSYLQTDQKFVATLKAVLKEVKKEDGSKDWIPLTNKEGKNISDSNQLIAGGQSINSGFSFRIVNNKTEVVFTKVGKEKVKGEDGKLKDKETPLKDVEFYLEKQDPDDIQKENQGYYPLTANMEMIKPRKNDDGTTTYYYISKKTGEEVKVKNYDPEKITNPPVGIYKSDDKGKFKITNLTDGYYRVIEPKPAKDENGKEYMKVNGPIKTFKVVDGRVKIYKKGKESTDKPIEAEVDGTSEATVTHIINQKPGKGEFTLTKEDENGGALDGVEFTLYKTDGETQVGETQTTGSDGTIKFTGLPYGYYWLKETKTKDGYILDTKKKLIALGGDKEWKTPDKREDVWKSIKFEGTQDELVSTADTPNKDTVYPNKAEGIFAKYKFKIDEKADIKPGDYFTIKFSNNVDLDGINKDNTDKGQKGDEYFNIIGPAGLLAKAKVNDDRRSITYTFTEYVKDYKPDAMSMFLQLFPNRRKVDHKQDIKVTADIGKNIDTNSSDYHYSDSINIDYRGYNDKGRYNGYQNPTSDISSYMLRLDPEHKTFTAIVYYNPWNKYLTNKNITFTADEDILVNENLSVKTYIKTGDGSHPTTRFGGGWQEGDLPDSYYIYEKDKDGNLKVRSDLSPITDQGDEYNWYPTKTWTEKVEVNGNNGYDEWSYDYNYGRYRYYKYVTKDNRDAKITRKIAIPYRYLNRQDDSKTATYVIEIKGQLAGDNVKSLKTSADYKDHNVSTLRSNGYYYYENTYTGNFETWSQFFNPGASGNVSKEIKLVNFKNKVEFAKVDGGVISNVVDKEAENPNTLKDLGIGNPLKGAEFKLVKDKTDVADSKRTSDQDGIFSWEGLAPGTYQVIETKSPDDTKYDLPKDAISSFKVDEDGNIVEVKNNKQILENNRKAQIKIRKTDQDGKALNGAKFLLTPTSGQEDPSNPNSSFPALTKPDTDNESEAVFTNLVAGKYTLTEEKAPDGYTKSEQKWEIEVTKDGKVKWLNSFDDTEDKMKAVSGITYSGDDDKENLKSEILGIDKYSKTFRQKITIKARPSDLEKARLILDSVSTDLKLSQTSTKVRLVQASGDTIIEPDNSSYTVEINNGNIPNLTLRINPPYREEKKNNPVGSSQGQSEEQTQTDADKEREYIFIVDMPYKDDTRIGAKATYDVGQVDKETGKVTFGDNDMKTELDKYVEKSSSVKPTEKTVDMTAYENKYLARDINLITTDIGNIKKPSIHFIKVDEKTEKALVGAEFELQKKQTDGTYQPIKKDGNVVTPAGTTPEDKWIATSDGEGKFSFTDLADGEYLVYETKSPSGYSLLKKDAYYIKVAKGKIYGKLKETDDYKEITDNTVKTPIQITNKKAEYPYTGGPGTWIGFTLAGLAVMLGGVFIYFKRQARLAQ